MGYFDYRCCISGLPIRAEDPVKYILLTQNPYKENEEAVYIFDRWFLRTYPVRAKYNDYGSIKDYDETSPMVWAMPEGFNIDLVELGTGDNCAHDVPTKKGMSFKEMLNAAWEGRLRVVRNTDELRTKITDPIELPTVKNITELLQKSSLKVNDTNIFDNEGFLVDEQDRGWVRIRQSGFGDRTSLEPLLPVLHQYYAAMITYGSGNYKNDKEIQVMPLPTEKHLPFRQTESKTPLRIHQAMILGEVWDEIIHKNQKQYTKIREEIQNAWDEPSPENPKLIINRDANEIPFTVGPDNHWRLIKERHRNNPFTEQQIIDFLDDMAGIRCIYRTLLSIDYWWRPGSCGSQGRHYNNDIKWHTVMLKVCKRLQNRTRTIYD